MKYLYNNPALKERRQSLRNSMTDAEKLLWQRLRKRQFLGLKFRRQFSVGNFILDFYSPELRLAIELDGALHRHDRIRDQERDAIIRASNIRVIRFWNSAVLNDIESVLDQIVKIISPDHRGDREG